MPRSFVPTWPSKSKSPSLKILFEASRATDLFAEFPAIFAGENVSPSAVLVRFTQGGDSNLDQRVDMRDLRRLAMNWNLKNKMPHAPAFTMPGASMVVKMFRADL